MNRALPVLLHGDAAFAGQGIVMETLQLAQLRGYRTGGTIHIIVARSGSDWIVSFADNGPGVSAEQRARASDARAVPPLRQGLAGIGLWVSTRIAEEHGGRLDIAPAPGPGAGTAVTLVLPPA